MYKQPNTIQARSRLRGGLLGLSAVTDHVELPAEITDAQALFDATKQRWRALPPTQVHRQAALDALRADPTANIAELVLAEAVREVEYNVLLEATDQAEARLAAAVRANADTIVADLRTAVFEPALAILTTVANETKPGDTAYGLLRDKRVEHAQALASASDATDRIAFCRRVRLDLYPHSGIDQLTAALYRNPDRLPASSSGAEPKPEDRVVAAIRAGAEPWLGTYTDVDARSQQIDRARKKKRAGQLGAQLLNAGLATTRP